MRYILSPKLIAQVTPQKKGSCDYNKEIYETTSMKKYLIWACKCNAIEVAKEVGKEVGWKKSKWWIGPRFGTITNHFGSKNLYKKKDSRQKNIDGSFGVVCG